MLWPRTGKGYLLLEREVTHQRPCSSCRWMARIYGSHGRRMAKGVDGSPNDLTLRPRTETSHGQHPSGCEMSTAALDSVCRYGQGVSLMVAWGGLLRGDLQPRALRGEKGGLSRRFGVKACCAEGRRLRSGGWSFQERVTNRST